MRGRDDRSEGLFSYVRLEERIPADHPLRAIRTCVDAGMPVEAEVVVTRPTMPHLTETIDVLTRVGVRTISLRRLAAVDVEPHEFVLLSPRMSLLADDLERAATIALQRRARLVIRDFPVCVAPRR